jgi:hypothetical protein
MITPEGVLASTAKDSERERAMKLLELRRSSRWAFLVTIIFTVISFIAGAFLLSGKDFKDVFTSLAILGAIIALIETAVTAVMVKSWFSKSRPKVLKRELSAIYFINLRKSNLNPRSEVMKDDSPTSSNK